MGGGVTHLKALMTTIGMRMMQSVMMNHVIGSDWVSSTCAWEREGRTGDEVGTQC